MRRWGVTVLVTWFLLLVAVRLAGAGPYDFRSIYSGASALGAFPATSPSVNPSGTIAFATLVFDPAANRSVAVVFRADRTALVPLLNLTDVLGEGVPSSVVINESGATAVVHASGGQAAIVRINADGTFVVVARADALGSAPYLEIGPTIVMNTAGQVAALVTNPDATTSIVRLDDAGAVEIARSSGALSSLSAPAINDAGVVAFTAVAGTSGELRVYSGSGGPLTDHGAPSPCPGPASSAPGIAADALVLTDCAGLPLFTARGGVVNILVSGSEAPIFSGGVSSQALSPGGRPAFVTRNGGSTEVGLFTGSDPVNDGVVRTADTVFGLAVQDIHMGHRAINDAGHVVFLLQVAGADGPVSHVVAATPALTPQTIDFPPLPNRVIGDPPFVVSATASSGLPVTFAASGTCAIAGATVTLLGADFCVITASQAGNETVAAAPDVEQTFMIEHGRQTIAFEALPDRVLGDPPFVVVAMASSGLPVTLSAAGACSIAGNLVTPGAAGSCTVSASQGGDGAYGPASPVSRTFAISRAGQVITFGAIPERTLGDPPLALEATSSSGLVVIFVAAGGCSVHGSTLTLTAAGTCTVTASQAGDESYLPAPDVVQAFAIEKTRQTITFGPLPDRSLGDASFEVAASASSGLPVAFTATGACTVAGATVSLIAAGPCSITASQDGNADVAAAVAVTQAFVVSSVILRVRFDGGPDGFTYVDDPFRATRRPQYASGAWVATGGFRGGALRVNLGGIDSQLVEGMSGGWTKQFMLGAPTKVVLYVRGNLTQSASYESDERSQLLVSVDGVLVPVAPNDYLAQVVGNGNSGTAISTGWRLFAVQLGTLQAGAHTLVIGGYNNKKTTADELTTVLVDDVVLLEGAGGARTAVDSLSFERFKDNVRVLAGFGDRTQGAPSNIAAGNWLVAELQAAGYTVVRHPFTYGGQPRDNIYVTKVGTVFPDQMYIVSAHMDGRGGGGAANDDASGCSLVLEAARALARVQTAVSVRFIFWNNEETGLNGSTAYVNQRLGLQGIETPIGSGIYPEPRWLGMIQHDQILFDHGLPPEPSQIPNADLDVEYQAASAHATAALRLANALRAGNQTYSTDYPAQVGSNMNYTDSVPFQNHTAAVSVRDNQRIAEIGKGSNPHWHQPTDVYTAFSDDDYRLGFNAVQMTLGTVAELSGASSVSARP